MLNTVYFFSPVNLVFLGREWDSSPAPYRKWNIESVCLACAAGRLKPVVPYKQKANVIGWWCRQRLSSAANQVAFFPVRAKNFGKYHHCFAASILTPGGRTLLLLFESGATSGRCDTWHSRLRFKISNVYSVDGQRELKYFMHFCPKPSTFLWKKWIHSQRYVADSYFLFLWSFEVFERRILTNIWRWICWTFEIWPFRF